MSTAAPSRLSRKRLRPGKVSARTSMQTTMSLRASGGSKASVARMYVSTLIPGSSSAATNVVTDCGALKNVRLWGSSNIKRRRDRFLRRHRWR